jgi:flagellar assembly factor FliW
MDSESMMMTTKTTQQPVLLATAYNTTVEGLETTTFNTSRFGEVAVTADRVLHFVSPILGFEGLKNFAILDHEEESPFKWLQSMEDPNLAFVITNPTIFGIEYEFVVPDDAVSLLGIETAEDTSVFTMVTIPEENPGKMTTNLLGPLVVNQHTQKAMQVILNDSKQYSTKVRLLDDDALAALHEAAANSSAT